jgi:hypothetical protein
MRPNLRQIDKAIDLAHEVIARDMTLKAKAVELRLLHHSPFAHHRPNLPRLKRRNQRTAPRSSGVFQHRVMVGRSSAKADTIGQDVEEETERWTILAKRL